MLLALTIIFAFMIFLVFLNKCNILFLGVFSLLIIVAISLAVGYGMALLVMSLAGLFFKILLIAIVIVVVITIITGIKSRWLYEKICWKISYYFTCYRYSRNNMDDDTNNFENCSNCVVDCSCYQNIQIKLKGV